MTKPAPHSTPQPRALDYPQGGHVDTTHGKLQCDGTKAGRLARLAYVARFVMARYELPPAEATAWLCDALEAANPALYLLNKSGWAVALPPDHSLAWELFTWDAQPAKPADCGLAGAVKHMRQCWDGAEPGKAGHIGEDLLDPLAVRLDDAFALWGYGTKEPAYKAAGEVRPLAGWQQNAAHGFMRFDSTPAGRLVRLAAVVRWFEADKALPRSKAVAALCDGLHSGALGALYRVRPGEYADRQPANHAYGYKTFSEVEDAQRRAAAVQRGGVTWSAAPAVNWVTGKPSRQSIAVRKPAVQPTPVAPGLPALLRRIRESWGGAPGARKGAGDVLDATTGELAALAITLDMAYALWGWGDVAQVVQLQSVPKADADAEAAPAKATSYDWSNAKTQAALLAAFKSAPGNSARDKAAHLATTEKWGGYSAETLRKKATVFKKNGVVEVKSKDADLSKVWGNTQRKS